jgi:hypothetical protein
MDTKTSPDITITEAPMSNDSYNNKEVSLPVFDLDGLPEDIKQEKLYPLLPPQVLGWLAQRSPQYETGTAFLRLLLSTVDAEPESYKQADETKLAAIAILKRHPELLFKTRQVTDHFGRKIKASPYRLFLGTGDIWALKQVHEEIIAKMEDQEARAQAEAQTKTEFQTQFPDYSGPWPLDPNMPEEVLYDKRNKEQIEQVIAQLKTIVEKITVGNDPCTRGQATKDETTKAVADLCKIFASKAGEVIKTGLHFPLGILKEIGKVYDTQFNLWSDYQVAFFPRGVIGGAVAALSAVDGQCVKGGLVTLNMEKGPDRRDGLFCRHPKGIPQDLAPLVGKLGRTMFVDPYDGYAGFISSKPGHVDWYNKNGFFAARVSGVAWIIGVSLVEKLMESKSKGLWELLCSCAQRSQHTVSMSITARCDV